MLGAPPPLDPLIECRGDGGELAKRERAELASAANLGVPGLSIGAAIKAARTVAGLLAPADLPGAVDLADAHGSLFR